MCFDCILSMMLLRQMPLETVRLHPGVNTTAFMFFLYLPIVLLVLTDVVATAAGQIEVEDVDERARRCIPKNKVIHA